jgi:hypothetical protein
MKPKEPSDALLEEGPNPRRFPERYSHPRSFQRARNLNDKSETQLLYLLAHDSPWSIVSR